MRKAPAALRRSALLTSLTSLVISGVGFTPSALAAPANSDPSVDLESPVEITPPPEVRSGRQESLTDNPVTDPAPTEPDPTNNPDPQEPSLPQPEPPQTEPPKPESPKPESPQPEYRKYEYRESSLAPASIRSGREHQADDKNPTDDKNPLSPSNTSNSPATNNPNSPNPPAANPLGAASPVPTTHTVVSGDNLWMIAAAHLEKIGGRVPTMAEIGNYWDQVCLVNQSRLQSGNVSLIYAGEIIDLPTR